MKKILLICISTLVLSACADKQQYEQAVLANMSADQDIKDYNIDPQEMTDCIVEVSSEEMPGVFPYDPDRLMAYQNYTKMLSMNMVVDKQKMLEELRSLFGSPKALSDAHRNYAESVMKCMSLIEQKPEIEQKSEPEVEIKDEQKQPVIEGSEIKDEQ